MKCTCCKNSVSKKDIMFSKNIYLNLKSGLVSDKTKFEIRLCPACAVCIIDVLIDHMPENELKVILNRISVW